MTIIAEPARVLLAALVALPLAAAVVVAVWSASGRPGRDWMVVVATGLTLLAAVLLCAIGEDVALRAPALVGTLELQYDPAGRLFALVAALVWFVVSLYAVGYLRDDPAAGRLQVASLVVLAGNLGVFVAADWLTLIVFFEMFGLTGLLFVVHAGGAEARRAGLKYFWLTMVGGIALLAGVALLANAGSGALAIAPAAPAAPWAMLLLAIGFGIKAGMLGLHVWLPDAHSVAPAPASALLSGVMIKAGAFGIFRCLSAMQAADETAAAAQLLGGGVLVLGLAGMLIGAVAALAQRHAKRLLAWSSVSQMGFILAALGTAALLENEAGRTAAVWHAINHALFKSALFLAVGAVVHAAGTADLARLGGALRRSPWLTAALLAAVAGIVGLPPFNGFVSKTLVHHALADIGAAEWIYYAASIGTAAMFVRLLRGLFAAPRDDAAPPTVPAPMVIAVVLLALAVAGVGVWPAGLHQALVLPAAGASPSHGLHFTLADRIAPFVLLAAGAAVALLAERLDLAARRPPAWLTVDAAYRAFGRAIAAGARRLAAASARWRAATQTRAVQGLRLLRRGLAVNWTDWSRVAALGDAMRLPHDVLYRHLDEQRDRIVAQALSAANRRSGDRHRAGAERLLDATRHYAGWLGTRLIHGAVGLEHDAGMCLARSPDCRDRLAQCAVEMAIADVDSGHADRAVAMGRRALAAELPSQGEASPGPGAFARSWLPELRSVLFHLLTDPLRRHWPVSESLAHGAVASTLRAWLQRLASDPGAGLALACIGLVALFVLLVRG